MRRTPLTPKPPTADQLRRNSRLAVSRGLIRGTQIAREAQWQARKPINAVSDKRKAENAVRRRVLAEMRQADPMCARCRVAPWTDGHELLPRSGGGSITDKANIRGLCRPCHTYVTEHPAEARATGWTLTRFGR